MKPSGEIAKDIVEESERWAAAIEREHHGEVLCYGLGSVYRSDFDPQRSDIDLFLLIDSVRQQTPSRAVETLRALRGAAVSLLGSLEERGIPVPVSPSAYFTREVEAGIHRTGDPDYYLTNHFYPLGPQAELHDVSTMPSLGSLDRIHPVLVRVVEFTQTARHAYLLGERPASEVRKLWEKIFHHMRGLLRLDGARPIDFPVDDRAALLNDFARHFSQMSLPLADLYQSMAPGTDPASFGTDRLMEVYEILGYLAWAVDSRAVRTWSYAETRHFASPDLLECLAAAGNRQALAVDHGIALYVPPVGKQMSPTIDIGSRQVTAPSEELVTDPDEQELRKGR